MAFGIGRDQLTLSNRFCAFGLSNNLLGIVSLRALQVVSLAEFIGIEVLGLLVVLILKQLFHGHRLGGNSLSGDLNLGSPSNAVEHYTTKVLIAPVPMEMAAGEAKAPMSTDAFISPGYMLWFLSLLHGGTHVWVAAMGSIAPVECFWRRKIGKNGGHAFHALGKAHVVVPFIVDFERFHAAGNGVIRKLVELGSPVWIDRPIRFEVTANQLEECIARFSLRDFYGVMNASDAHTLFSPSEQFLQVGIGWMSATAIGVHHNGVGSLEDAFVFGPTVLKDDGFHIGRSVLQRLG